MHRHVAHRRFDRLHGVARTAALVALLGLLVPGGSPAALAQASGPGFFDGQRNFYGWLRHVEGDQLGEVAPFTAIGGTGLFLANNGVWMFNGEALVTNDGDAGGSLGLGRRFWVGAETILGASLAYEVNQTEFENTFRQSVLSLELFRSDWSVRSNLYAPIGDRLKNALPPTITDPGQIAFSGNNLITAADILRIDETSMAGFDFELARNFGGSANEVFLGYYNLSGEIGQDTDGFKGGARTFLTSRLAASLTVSDDPLFDTNVYGGLSWFFGRSRSKPRSLEDKLTLPIERNTQVAVHQIRTGIAKQTVLTSNGTDLITVTHVASGGSGGDGTFENPYGILNDAGGAATDIVYVASGSAFSGEEYSLAPGQSLLGEGGGADHRIEVDLGGMTTTISLPAVNGAALPRPVISGAPGAAITLNDGTRVSNFDIFNAGTGILADNLLGSADVSRVLISGGLSGVDVVRGVGQLSFTETEIVDPGSVAFNINGGSASVTYQGSISKNSPGGTIEITNHTGGGFDFLGGSISVTDGTGLQFNNTDGTYDFGGTLTLSGGDAGIDIQGNSNGTFTFADATITDPQGVAFNVDGGTASVTFNGNITGNSAGSTVAITNHGLGTFTFQNGTISATDGTGLQFNNSDGFYNFNGTVVLNGGDAGIDILGNSSGTFNFADTTITDPTGTAFSVNGGSANVTFAGSIGKTTAGATIAVTNHAGGSLAFGGGTISASNGTGLQFNNSDGSYAFTGTVTLNGGDAGIDILGSSTGTFNFADTSIVNPLGTAFNINGGSSSVTYNGSMTKDGPGSVLAITNHAGGSFTFGSGSISASDGIGLRFSGADGAYALNGSVVLDGGDAGIDIVGNSNGTFSFANTTILDPTGTAFNVSGLGPNGRIDFNGSIRNDNSDLIVISTTAAGSSINFNATGSNTLDGTGGGGIRISNANGNVSVTTPTTIIDPSGAAQLRGISVAGGNGTVEFRDTTIQVPSGLSGVLAAVGIDGHNGSVSFTNLNISTDSAGTAGFSARLSGDVSVDGASRIDVIGGDALILVDVDDIDMAFDSISVTDSQAGFGAGSGITLLRVTAGTLDVVTTAIDATALNGVDVDGSGASVTLDSVNIDGTAGDGIAVGVLFGNPGSVVVGGGTISNVGGDGVHVDDAGNFVLDNVEFLLVTGFTANVTNSTVGGSGNTAVPFSCNDGGGNTGQILFNGGADSCGQ